MGWMGTTVQKRTELSVDEIEALRLLLKTQGLDWTVQQMSVDERGLARRAIREGLALLIESKKGGVMR